MRYLLDGLRKGNVSRGEELLSTMDGIYTGFGHLKMRFSFLTRIQGQHFFSRIQDHDHVGSLAFQGAVLRVVESHEYVLSIHAVRPTRVVANEPEEYSQLSAGNYRNSIF